MGRDELVVALERKPFQSFFLHVSDGTRYKIESPFGLMVTATAVVVGRDLQLLANRYPFIDHFDVVDLLHITRIETQDKGNGRP